MPSESVKVSVIVVNFNGMSYIESCLRSILKQDFAHFEVILVDNKSSDKSLDYARQQFPGVIIVANEKNLGYSGGINSSIGYAHGEYLAPINVDTEVKQGWLAAMVNFMNANPEVGGVTPKSLLYRDREKVGVMGLNIHITGLGFVRGLNRQDSDLPKEPFQVAGVSGCSYLMRREIMERMGGLNEENFMYYDDVDLSWMINLMGYKIYCVPQSVVYHEYEPKMTPQKMFWLEYGRANAILSYLKPFTFIVLLPALAFTEALIAGYCLLRGPSYIKAKVRVCVAILRDLRATMRRRRQVQKLRKLSDFQLLRRFKLNYEWGQVLHILRRTKANI
jgi:GT2 family glycosyltransferase